MLVAVIFLLAILILSLAVALPKVREDIQRDREVETMHRGKQYARAIKLYYKKFNAYPPNVDALVKTNEIRFLRKRYTDPMTGKDDWHPIMFGQNKTPMAMGFFGQPLGVGGSPLAGTGPSGGNGLTGASGFGAGGSGLGSNGSTFGSSGSTFGSSGGSFSGQSGSNGSASGTNSGTDTSGTTGGLSSGSGLGTSLSSNQTFGGGGIIGFAPGSPKPSILLYKKKDHFNEWEFLYSPLSDRTTGSSNLGAIGTPVGATPGSGTQLVNGGFPTNGAGNGVGNGNGPGNGPTQPSAPTPPADPNAPAAPPDPNAPQQ